MVLVGLVGQRRVDGDDEVGFPGADEVDDLIAQCDVVEPRRVRPVEVDVLRDPDDRAGRTGLVAQLSPSDVVREIGVEHAGKVVGDRDVKRVPAEPVRIGGCKAPRTGGRVN